MPLSPSSTARARTVTSMAFVLAAFHLLSVSGILVVSTMVVRVLHLGVVLALVFLKPWEMDADLAARDRWINLALFVLALLSSSYLLVRWEEIALSGGITNEVDVAVGGVLVLLVLEATRRAVGRMLALITLAFLLYPFVSPYLRVC